MHQTPTSIAEAERIQDDLRTRLDLTETGPDPVQTVAGLDVAYDSDSDCLAAAVVVLDAATLSVVDQSTVVGTAKFDYVPGLLAFREAPALLEALDKLSTKPDLLVCDGYGIAHPRRFGLACHVGVLSGLPTFGVAKTPFVGAADSPALGRGSYTDLVDAGEVVGRAVRTQDAVKPVYVSVGHRIDLDTAYRHVLALTPRYRLPETTRRADRLCRDALAG